MIRPSAVVLAALLTVAWSGLARAHGADVVMLEARIQGQDVDAIAYLGQKPVMRMVAGRDDRPVNPETIAEHAKAIVAHAEKTMGFRTKEGACEAGPVLLLDKDPDGQAVRLVRRYRCRGIDVGGVQVDFRPFVADQPFKVFLLGIFFAIQNGAAKTQAHTFTGGPIWVHPESFREPARADRIALFPALFPPPSPLDEKPGRLGRPLYIQAAIVAILALGALAMVARRQRRLASR